MVKRYSISFLLEGKSLGEIFRQAEPVFDDIDILEFQLGRINENDRISAMKFFPFKRRIVNIQGVNGSQNYIDKLVLEALNHGIEYVSLDFGNLREVKTDNLKAKLIVNHHFKGDITPGKLEGVYRFQKQTYNADIIRMFVNPKTKNEVDSLDYFMKNKMPEGKLVVAARGDVGRKLNFNALELGAPFVCSSNTGDLPSPTEYLDYWERAKQS